MKYLKTISIYGIIYIGLITVFIGLLALSAALPKSRSFQRNMRYAAKSLHEEGDWPYVGGVKLDNFTDALILNVGFSFDSSSPLKSALNPGYAYPKGEESGISAVHYLDALMSENKPEMQFYSYRRYWFRYQSDSSLSCCFSCAAYGF